MTRADVLVVGGGMAGLSAGAAAAAAGARVVVAEKLSHVGGSAALSAGIVWTAPDRATLREVVPDGDPSLGDALIDGFEPAVAAIREAGVDVTERWLGQMGFGAAYRVDIAALLAHLAEASAAGGGAVLLETRVRGLLLDDDGTVRGARLRGPDGPFELEAGAVVLATGGFQGDPELRQAFLGAAADRMLVRSNPGSVGDGLRLGRDAGASLSRCLSGFYGHLLPSPLDGFGEEHYLPLTQYHSNHCVLVNRRGRRFTDESLGDEVSNQALLREPDARGVLLCDERVRREYVVTVPYPHGQLVDRFAGAEAAGARIVHAPTREALLDAVASWGVDRAGLAATLEGYDAAAAGQPVPLDAPARAPEPLREPPFHAVEVQPAITFPFGGLRADVDGHVLDRDGRPLRGLYAAGADVGGLQDVRYVGGLVLGLVFGRRAGETAAAEVRVGA